MMTPVNVDDTMYHHSNGSSDTALKDQQHSQFDYASTAVASVVTADDSALPISGSNAAATAASAAPATSPPAATAPPAMALQDPFFASPATDSAAAALPHATVHTNNTTTAKLRRSASNPTSMTHATTTNNVNSNTANNNGNNNSNGSKALSFTTTPATTPTVTSSSAAAGATAPAVGMTAIQRGRTYRVSTANNATNKWVTREIAALDFLLNIPMEGEHTIVHHGWLLQQQQHDDFYQPRGGGGGGGGGGMLWMPLDGRGNQNTNNEEAKRPEDEVAVLEPPTSSQAGRWWEKLVGEALTSSTKRVSRNNSTVDGGVESTMLNPSGMTNEADHHLLSPPPLPQSASGDDLTQQQQPQSDSEQKTLQQPTILTTNSFMSKEDGQQQQQVVPFFVPSRRLDGDDAFLVQIPLKVDTMTRQKFIARQAAIREWEQKVAYGLFHDNSNIMQPTQPLQPQQQQQQLQQLQFQQRRRQPPMLDGRMFFSASGSYPIGVFSVLRYEPRKEEEARLRQKLEARGGGGTQFAVPERDWRGTTYRALLPRNTANPKNKAFSRFLKRKKRKKQKKKKKQQLQHDDDDDDDHYDRSDEDDYDDDDDDSVSSTSSSEVSDTYVPGFLDDPEMVQGRHRNLMIGDRNTGCIIVSTIQFVEPALLKADLNKQFRERFESWEPPKSQRKYIGARVVDGVYTLMETEEQNNQDVGGGSATSSGDRSIRRTRQSSVTHVGGSSGGNGATMFDDKDNFRMPPSLTLSKIRSVKQQALLAAVKAKLEISTVALACIYFERLCLDCRVDKSNRRLCFASCLLLSLKINEAYVGLVTPGSESQTQRPQQQQSSDGKRTGLHSLIRTTNKSQTMFASLLEFFTQEWQLSLKQLFAAEWGVFAALGFSLNAKPSHVAFHFKRLMKTLEWSVIPYLGRDMYNQWQDVLEEEESRRRSRERRREIRRKRKEQNLIALQRELQVDAERREKRLSDLHKGGWNRATDDDTTTNNDSPAEVLSPVQKPPPPPSLTSPTASTTDKLSATTHHTKTGRMKLLYRLSIKKSVSHGKLHNPSNDPPQPMITPPTSTPLVAADGSFARRKRLSLSPSMPMFITQPTPPLVVGSSDHIGIAIGQQQQHEEDSDILSDDGSDAGIIV